MKRKKRRREGCGEINKGRREKGEKDGRREGKREGMSAKGCQKEIWRQGEEGKIVREMKRGTKR